MPTLRRELIDSLEAQVKSLEASNFKLSEAQESFRTETRDMRVQRDAANKQESETRKQFDDLKQRLHESELENQRLLGYIQRVQEDDIVREELVMTGDPAGEQRLMPKRKSTIFAQPYEYRDEEPRKRQHWITY